MLPVASAVAGVVNFAFGLIPLFAIAAAVLPGHLTLNCPVDPAHRGRPVRVHARVRAVARRVNVFYRDVGNLARHVLRLWFYLSPALYRSSGSRTAQSRDDTRLVGSCCALNPFAILFEVPHVIYGEAVRPTGPQRSAPPPAALARCVVSWPGGIATLLFKRLEPAFAKVL